MSGGKAIKIATYSFNAPMIGLAKSLGFVECHRDKNVRVWKGESIDRIEFS
jgi:RimJ/RimL family protein N-acetyltransferase